MKTFLLATILVLITFCSIFGQENTAQQQRTEVRKLESMVGQWKGSGWMQQGPNRQSFTGTETVQKKLDGLALLIEGKFANAEGKVIHETLAVLGSNQKDSKYSFRTYLATGLSGEYDFRLVEGGYEWGFQTQAGTIRYTIKTDNDVWFEVGEFSRDGQNWMKFFEMKLDKVK